MPTPPPRRLTAALILTVALLVPAVSASRPLTVRARTQVNVEVSRTTRGVVLRGRLVDDQEQPVAHERIFLELEDRPPEARTTDDDGAFEVLVETDALPRRPDGALRWTVRYNGDHLRGATIDEGNVDLSRAPSLLQLRIDPTRVGLGEGFVYVFLTLTSDGQPLDDANIHVRVGDGEELLGHTDRSGRVDFRIPPDLLGEAGAYEVRARYPGDVLHAGATATASFEVSLPARLTLRVGREGDLHVGRYRFSGRLADAHGPIAGATVAIIARPTQDPSAEPTVEAVATTRADGIYLAVVGVRDLLESREGEIELVAVYEPSDARHQAAMSAPVTLRVPPPPGIPLRWYVSGLLALAALLGLAQLVRHEVPRAVLARLRALGARRRRPTPGDLLEDDPPFVQAGADAPGRVRATDRVAGMVVDAHGRAAVADASVVVTPDGGEPRRATVSRSGAFAVDALPPGRYTLRVEAAAYLPRELAFAVPHDGRLDGAVYTLVAIRRRVRDAYARAVEHRGAAMKWGVDTPLEAFQRARPAEAPADHALGELRALVEIAWFSPHRLVPEDAVRARQLLDHLARRAEGGAVADDAELIA